jgi:hypothetical protein
MNKLKIKDMDITTGGVLVGIVNAKDAKRLDLHSLDRVKVRKGNKEETIVLDIAETSKSWG